MRRKNKGNGEPQEYIHLLSEIEKRVYAFDEKKINDFIEKYNFKMMLIPDTNHLLTNFLDAKVTPECFLTDSNLSIIYSGLIDDWVKELGRKRTHIENNYLEKNLDLYLKNEPMKIKKTKAIGCIIQR